MQSSVRSENDMDLEIERKTSMRKRSEGKEGAVVDMSASCIWCYKAEGRHMHKPSNIDDMPEGTIIERANEYKNREMYEKKRKKRKGNEGSASKRWHWWWFFFSFHPLFLFS
jgi:hypothetical protein